MKPALKALIRKMLFEELQAEAPPATPETPAAEMPTPEAPAEPAKPTTEEEIKELVDSLVSIAETKQDLFEVIKLSKAAIQQKTGDQSFLKKLYKEMIGSDNLLVNQAAERNRFLFPENLKEKD